MKLTIAIFALLLASCGRQAASLDEPTAPAQACGQWSQIEQNYCGGRWLQSCTFEGGVVCIYSWACGQFSGPSCFKQ